MGIGGSNSSHHGLQAQRMGWHECPPRAFTLTNSVAGSRRQTSHTTDMLITVAQTSHIMTSRVAVLMMENMFAQHQPRTWKAHAH